MLGLGASAVAIVAIALTLTASSQQRIDVADREYAATQLLEQRQLMTSLIATELAENVAEEIGQGNAPSETPSTAIRLAALDNSVRTAADLIARGDSVGNEAQRWLSAIMTETDPSQIEDPFDRWISYDGLLEATCCAGVVASDSHHTDVIRDLEYSATIPSSVWQYFYVAVQADSKSPAAERFLKHLGIQGRSTPSAPSPRETLSQDLSGLATLGASQESINALLASDPVKTLDRISTAATGQSVAPVSVAEAWAAANTVSGNLDGLYGQAVNNIRSDLTTTKKRAEQLRLIALSVTPVLLLVLIGVGFVVFRSARNREKELAHERELLDARNRFMRMVSHELRTPATAISGFAQMLTTDWTSLAETEITEFLAIVDRQSTHLSLIVDDLLTLSHLETGRLRLHLGLVNLRQAADDAIGMVDARYGIEVTSEIDPTIMLLADPDRLLQILRNLVENAAKYGKTGVGVNAVTDGGGCRITVYDNGPGVPVEAAKRIFRFWDRGAHEGDQIRGHGMGLAIARHLAMAMVGDLIYQPHEPMGSEFVLTLPAGPPQVLAEVPQETSLPTATAS